MTFIIIRFQSSVTYILYLPVNFSWQIKCEIGSDIVSPASDNLLCGGFVVAD